MVWRARYPQYTHFIQLPTFSSSGFASKLPNMSNKSQGEGVEQAPKDHKPKEQKSDDQQDLTTFLSESQCQDLTLLIATIAEGMRRAVESYFNPRATLNSDLISSSDKSEDEKINSVDPGKVDVGAYEAEKKLLAEREKAMSAPNVTKLKDEVLKDFDEWRLLMIRRVGEAVHLEEKAKEQIAEAGENYEGPPTPPNQVPTETQKVEDHKAPKLEDTFPRIKTPLTKLSLGERRLILHSILLLALSLETYSARSRVLLLFLTSSLKLGLKALQEEEVKVAKGLLETAKEIHAEEEARERAEASKQSRKWKMRAATAAGAAIVGYSGGMAAPMVASGVGAIMGGLGLGSTAVAGYLGSVAGSTYVVGALFGAYGGQMTGQMMDNLSREVEDFAFLPVHGRRKEFADDKEAATEERRLRVTIGITGWLTEKEEIVKPWRVLSTGSEVFALRWELETLMNLGNSMNTMLSSAAWGYAQNQAIQKTMFAELATSVMWPMGIAKVARVVDNPFTLAKARADKAGEVLADALVNKAQGQRSVTLIGYSLGARAIYSCLTSLAKRSAFGLVESAILIGAPTPSDTASWRALRTACTGRLINVYSGNDRILAFLYRTSSVQYGVAGLSPISGLPGIENVDVSETVTGHLRYRFLIGAILQQLGLQDLDKEEIKNEAAAYEKLIEEEKEQDVIRQAKEKSQSYLGKKFVSDNDADREAGNMEKEIEQKNQKSMMQWASEQLYISRSGVSPDDAASIGGKALKSGANAADDAAVASKSYYQAAKEKLYLSRSGSKNEDLAKEGISEVGPGYMTQVAMWAAQHLPTWHRGAAGAAAREATGATGQATDTVQDVTGQGKGYLAAAAQHLPSWHRGGGAADAAGSVTGTVPAQAPADGDSKGGYMATAASYLPSWSSKKETPPPSATEKALESQQSATDKAGETVNTGADASGEAVKTTAETAGSATKGATDTVGKGIGAGLDKAGAETAGEKVEEVVDAVGVTPKNAAGMAGKGGNAVVDKVGDAGETGVKGAGKVPELGVQGAEQAGEVTGLSDGAGKAGEAGKEAADQVGGAGEAVTEKAGDAATAAKDAGEGVASGATDAAGTRYI
ncbi:MAG: hypothetical protein LQ342_006048 [Letrouitia transgressa]|nr:MAG: hypothetical protein LQ342_006048 [Letrouitia transgressa]